MTTALTLAQRLDTFFPVLSVERIEAEIRRRDAIEASDVHVDALRMRAGPVEGMNAAAAAEVVLRCVGTESVGGDRVGALVFNDSEVTEVKPHRSRNTVMQILRHTLSMNHALRAGREQENGRGQLNKALLEAERLNSRHEPLSRSTVRVSSLVEELIDDFFDRNRKRISVIDNSDGASVNIDEARVSLLLKNLLSNALRYSPETSGPVELEFHMEDDELVLVVRDHGPGLPAEQAARLGEPFYRGDPSRARQTGGTGLGLYLATLVARAHGGALRLLDTAGQGACFEARLRT